MAKAFYKVHFDAGHGLRLCRVSGGNPHVTTTNHAKVTCKTCLRLLDAIAKADGA